MPKRPPPLTEDQKAILKKLEPKLRSCVKTADIDTAKTIAAKIQRTLKGTGHITRWLQCSNWLAACALAANDLSFAIHKLEATRTIMEEGTRTHTEASALLALCYIRRKQIAPAKKLVSEVLRNVNDIKSDRRRRQFHKRFISRIEEECILAGLSSEPKEDLDTNEVQKSAVSLLSLDEQTLINRLGEAIPPNAIAILEDVRIDALKQLPTTYRKLLPTTTEVTKPKELGRRARSALKHVVWRALCNPKSNLYKAWSKNIPEVFDKGYLTSAVIVSCGEWSIGASAIVIYLVAIAFRKGAASFCTSYEPDSVMIGLDEK